MAEAEREPSLANKEDLWGQLLGAKLDRIDEENRTVTRLVKKFCENKEEIVRYHHESVSKLQAEISEASTDEAERMLLFLWAEHEWRSKRTGTKYRLNTDFDTELDRLREEDNIVQKLSENLALVWTPEEKRRYLKQSDSIQSTVLTEARPVFIRLTTDEEELEIRGPVRLLGKFEDELSESESVEEVEPEPTEEPILDTLTEFFETEMEVLTLIEARFHSTNLPGKSSLTLHNPDGINEDLAETPLYEEHIDTQNLADVDYLKFYHEKSGVQVQISVEQGDEGITFDVDDSNLPEDEKKDIRKLLKEKVGISVDALYPYDPQHHKEHIINRILAEDLDVYQKYYDKLDNESSAFIDTYVIAEGDDNFRCFSCEEKFWEPNLDNYDCPYCGGPLFRGGDELSLDVDEDAILDSVAERVQSFDIDIDDSEGTRLINLDFEKKDLDNNTYLRSTFHLAETAGDAMGRHWYEYFTYCLGNGDIPKRINDYLLHTVLITYGRSQIRGRENFGTISLYDFLEGDDPERLFVEAVKENRSKLRRRVREQAEDAQERLITLQQKVEDGTIEDAGHEAREKLKAEYDYDEFERDVFYVLKEMFLFTERWGREGKKETDGCLFLPEDDGGYFVASYDPKLTYVDEGYDVDAHEKNKAAYYILAESDHEYISKVLGDGRTIDGHIFVSDIFRDGQFEPVAETVQDWFSLVEDGDQGIDVPVVFLALDALLDLYDVFQSHYDFIIEHSHVQEAFRGEIQNQFSAEEGYVEFDDTSVEDVKEAVLEANESVRKKRAAKPHSDSE